MSLPLPRGSQPALELEENGLYIVLCEEPNEYRWHWVLYLHLRRTDGCFFHITRPSRADPWVYEDRTISNVVFSSPISVALKVAVVPPDMQDALRARIGAVAMEDTRRFGPLMCRVWVLQALAELEDEGYISIKAGSTIEQIGEEAKGRAERNEEMAQGGRELGPSEKVLESMYSLA